MGGLFGGGPDTPEQKKLPPPEPIEDDAEAKRLAQQRTDLDRKRKGRSSLVIKPNRNPGISGVANSGLRIPQE